MILTSIFAENPFVSLRSHMDKTIVCMKKTGEMFDALFAGKRERVSQLAKEISQVEQECDIIKQNIRSTIHKTFFLPVDRRDILHVLSNMDNIADDAEDIGVMLNMRWMELPASLQVHFLSLLKTSGDAVLASADVINCLDRLLEAGFSGPDAEEVLEKINLIETLEHESDKAQDIFGKSLFAHEDELKPAALFMWMKISHKVADLANCAERMTNHVRLMLYPE